MEELPVAEEPRFTRGGGTEVVDFEQVSMTKVQSTSGADAALAVEEDSGPPRDIGAAAQTYWPAIPVGTFYADQISRAFDAATHGTKTPQQALQDAQTATEAELQKALAG